MAQRQLKRFFLRGLFALLVFSTSAGAVVMPIALDDINFTPDPDSAVAFNPDGSVLLEEDGNTGVTLLTNAPPSEPEVIFAGVGRHLSFFYELSLGTLDQDDYFAAVLLDTGLFIPPFEFFTDTAGSGTVTFDLSSLVDVSLLGIEFSLESGFDDEYGSTVRISDLKVTAVPEPLALLLFVTGLLGGIPVWLKGRRGR